MCNGMSWKGLCGEIYDLIHVFNYGSWYFLLNRQEELVGNNLGCCFKRKVIIV